MKPTAAVLRVVLGDAAAAELNCRSRSINGNTIIVIINVLSCSAWLLCSLLLLRLLRGCNGGDSSSILTLCITSVVN